MKVKIKVMLVSIVCICMLWILWASTHIFKTTKHIQNSHIVVSTQNDKFYQRFKINTELKQGENQLAYKVIGKCTGFIVVFRLGEPENPVYKLNIDSNSFKDSNIISGVIDVPQNPVLAITWSAEEKKGVTFGVLLRNSQTMLKAHAIEAEIFVAPISEDITMIQFSDNFFKEQGSYIYINDEYISPSSNSCREFKKILIFKK